MKASQEFKVGKNGITWVGQNFKDHFYDMEMDSSTAPLYFTTLERPMLDKDIIREFNPGEVSLGEFLNAMRKQGDGWFFAYVKDKAGVPWALHCDQVGDYRDVDALSVGGPDEWRDGSQFASRNSSTPGTLAPSSLGHLDSLTLESVTLSVQIDGRRFGGTLTSL